MTNWIEITAIITGPISAVAITLWYNSYREKRQQKVNLFLTLIATRKTNPIPERFVDSLNMIDVVFHNKKEIIKQWKRVFESLHNDPFQVETYDKRMLDLLDAMAKELGYSGIKQTDLSDFYAPQLYANKQQFQEKFNEEILRVIENSKSFSESKK